MVRPKNAVRFAYGAIAHILGGWPTVSEEQMIVRQEMCLDCDMFDHTKTCCSICECPIRDRDAWFNYIAWADKKCPKGYWPAVEPMKSPGVIQRVVSRCRRC